MNNLLTVLHTDYIWDIKTIYNWTLSEPHIIMYVAVLAIVYDFGQALFLLV